MKLFLKTALFAVVMPGAFAVLVPILLAGDRTAAGGPTLGLALCLFGLGIVLYFRSAWDFAVFGGGTPAPIDAPKRLVIRGFYRYVRNPMYVASLTVVIGWGALFGAAILFAYAAALFVFFSLFVRLYEEPRLAREFGSEYTAYVAQVGRWLPGRHPRKPGGDGARAPARGCAAVSHGEGAVGDRPPPGRVRDPCA